MIRFLLVFALVFSPLGVLAEVVSFDLDETLISSANMTNGELKKAKELGFKIQTTKTGDFRYIVRPGADEVLAKAKELGFTVIIITSNFKSYAKDILISSGLNKYIDAVYAAEDLREDYNEDFDLYPYHRNRTYMPARTFAKKAGRAVQRYTIGLYDPVIKRSFLFATGNTNIRPYFPTPNTAKYPPLYGSRFHVDDTLRNIDKPLDFVGLHVVEFDGTRAIKYTTDGKPVWTNEVIEQLEYLKKYGWVDLYRRQYHKDPVESVVKAI